MKLKSINKNLSKWNFPQDMNYENDNFHGHQIGVAVGMTKVSTGEICQNYLSEELGDAVTREFLLKELINDDSILKVEKRITQFEDGDLVDKLLYYLPYYVIDHSVLQATANYSNIHTAINVTNHCKVEVLFVEDDLNRYITMSFDSGNMSIMDLVHDAFEDGMEDADELAAYGIHYEIEDDDKGFEESGYYLDFYDEAGEKYDLCFNEIERLRDAIVSVRLLENIVEIIKE